MNAPFELFSWRASLAGLMLCTSAALAQVGDKVRLPAFAIDRTEVTIGQFERYVRATGTVTRAEKEGGGFEFGAGWERRPGWSWRAPDGQPTTENMPAVHLDFTEAQAYCRWAGGRLPTGAEWQSAGFTELRDAPENPGSKAKHTPGPLATVRKAPTPASPTPGRVQPQPEPPGPASTGSTTWAPTFGNGRATRKAMSAERWAAPGGTAPST